ncbi:hypothetical protein [Priestia filamentosa]
MKNRDKSIRKKRLLKEYLKKHLKNLRPKPAKKTASNYKPSA